MVTAVELANGLSRRWAQEIRDNENTVVCGAGAWTLLAVLLAGADGEAERELSDVVGLRRQDTAAGFNEVGALVQRAAGVHLASGLWTRPDLTVHPSFAAPFDGLEVATLSTDQGVLDRWASESTNGLIDTFPAQVTDDHRLVAATAVATDVDWTVPFEGGIGTDWGGGGGEYTSLSRATAALDDAAIAEGPTVISRTVCATTSEVDVHLVAGAPGDDPASVLTTGIDALSGRATVTPGSELRIDDSAGCLTVTEGRGFDSQPVLRVGVPAFEVAGSHNLLDHKGLFGLTAASDPRFGHFPDLAEEPLAVEAAAQDAIAAFSDTGFRAAAVTAAMAVASGLPSETKRTIVVNHNRPFGFLAVERRSGLVLFAGWVADVGPLAPPPPR